MANVCICGQRSNAGVLLCNPGYGAYVGIWTMNQFADDGTENTLDPALMGSNASYLTDLINQTDKSKRLWVLPLFTDINESRGDVVSEDAPDGTTFFLDHGIRNIVAQIWGKKASPILAGIIDEWRCEDKVVFFLDENGNVIGKDAGDSLLHGHKVDDDSWSATFISANKRQSVKKVQLVFNLSTLTNDRDFTYVNQSSILEDTLSLQGLKDVVITATNPSTTGVELALAYFYGALNEKIPVTGLDMTTAGAAELTLINTSTGNSTIDIDSAAENTDGVYTVVYAVADQPIAPNVIQGTVAKNGLEQSTQTWETA